MNKPLLAFALVATLGACSRNPDPEYASDGDVTAGNAVQSPDPEPEPAPAVVASARMSDAEAMRLGREVTALMYAQNIAAVWPRFDADMQAGLQSEATFTESVGRMFASIGTEASVVSETIETRDDAPDIAVYVRRAQFATAGEGILSIAFHPDGTIGGMRIRPAD